MGNKLYSIGELSKLTGISKKALRFYDEKGILVPDTRDPQTGYRFYSEKQLLEAIIIQEMKQFNLSLIEIRDIMQNRDLAKLDRLMKTKIAEMTKTVEAMKDRLKAMVFMYSQINSGLAALEKRRSLQENSGESKYEMAIKKYPSVTGVFTRYKSEIFIEDMFWNRYVELQKIAAEENVFINGSLTAIFHDHYTNQFFFEKGDLEVFLPIIPSATASNRIKIYDEFLGASTIHIGNYTEMLKAYVALVKMIEKAGYEITGQAMEQYIISCDHVQDPEEYVTEIIFPVKKIGKH